LARRLLLRSYGAAIKVIGNADKQETGRWLNNLVENSHPLPGNGLFANHEKGPFRRRERAMLRFRRMRTLQKFVPLHASTHNHFNHFNHFNQERHLYSRSNFKLKRTAALAEWPQLCSA
jgi:putative transposase